MRVFIAVLVLIFSFQSFTKADDIDDIRDFEIEGMSIGNSLLDYFSKEVILERMKTDYASKKFSRLDSFKEDDANFINYTIYDGMQFHFKTKDKKFIILAKAVPEMSLATFLLKSLLKIIFRIWFIIQSLTKNHIVCQLGSIFLITLFHLLTKYPTSPPDLVFVY